MFLTEIYGDNLFPHRENVKSHEIRCGMKTNEWTYMYKSMLYTLYTSYKLQSPTWPSSGTYIIKDRYFEIFQKFLK
jgi:hypothetical protein